jgi:hypothetical protein
MLRRCVDGVTLYDPKHHESLRATTNEKAFSRRRVTRSSIRCFGDGRLYLSEGKRSGGLIHTTRTSAPFLARSLVRPADTGGWIWRLSAHSAPEEIGLSLVTLNPESKGRRSVRPLLFRLSYRLTRLSGRIEATLSGPRDHHVAALIN